MGRPNEKALCDVIRGTRGKARSLDSDLLNLWISSGIGALTISQCIHNCKVVFQDLRLFPLGQKVRRKRYGTYNRLEHIPDQSSLERRLAVMNIRQRITDQKGVPPLAKAIRGLFYIDRSPVQVDCRPEVRQKTASAVRAAVAQNLRPHKARAHANT
ncbi:MAG: hypothetical protein R3B95_06630 [Nitrospirales bacterium]|nr:hypothetical protein [Nitrospirales bacterium]